MGLKSREPTTPPFRTMLPRDNKAGPTRPNQPLRATRAFHHGSSTQAGPPVRAYLASHAKSGPFLGPSVSRAKYWKKPPLSHAHWPPPDPDGALSEEEADLELALSRAQTRFSEVSVTDRRHKIREILHTICQTRPLIESRAGFRSASQSGGGGRRVASTSRERPGTRSTPVNTRTQRSGVASAPSEVAGGSRVGRSHSPVRLGRSPSTPSIAPRRRPHPMRRQMSSSQLSTIPSLASEEHRSSAPRQVTSQSIQVEPEDLASLAASVTLSPSPSLMQSEVHQQPCVGHVDESNTIVNDPPECALPVVRGVGMDYIHANIDGAAVMGHHKRAQSSASSAQATSISGHRPGTVPKYLRHRQKEWDEEAMRIRKEQENADIPKDHKVLTESDRHETLRRLNDRYEEVIMDLNRLPVSSDTMRIRARRKVLEEELNSLDEAIKTYSRPRVFVLDQ